VARGANVLRRPRSLDCTVIVLERGQKQEGQMSGGLGKAARQRSSVAKYVLSANRGDYDGGDGALGLYEDDRLRVRAGRQPKRLGVTGGSGTRGKGKSRDKQEAQRKRGVTLTGGV
jgi:hypothetical protein